MSEHDVNAGQPLGAEEEAPPQSSQGPDLSDYSLPPEPPAPPPPPPPERRAKPPSRLAEREHRSRSVLTAVLVLAVLSLGILSAGLGARLALAQEELAQLRRNPDASSAPEGEVLPDQDGPGDQETPPEEAEHPQPERPAYQDLYPELYAQPHEWNAEEEGKMAYLTFDDGPSLRTPEILEILEEYGVKGTFFLVGGDSQQGRQWMREIAAAGHTIGVHSYSHNYSQIYASVEAFLEDFAQEYHLIEEVTGTAPQIFRFPGGSVNAYNGATYQEIISEMTRRGFVYYDWNRQTGDAVKKTPSASVLVKNALSKLEGTQRIILLAHDSKRYTNTVQALPAIIEGYQEAGFALSALTPEVRPIIFDYPK